MTSQQPPQQLSRAASAASGTETPALQYARQLGELTDRYAQSQHNLTAAMDNLNARFEDVANPQVHPISVR